MLYLNALSFLPFNLEISAIENILYLVLSPTKELRKGKAVTSDQFTPFEFFSLFPLVVAILLGRFGYKLKLITYTTQSANLMVREIGICLFLASVGIGAGEQFFETAISENGLLWILCGFLITSLPLLTVGFFARKFGFIQISF